MIAPRFSVRSRRGAYVALVVLTVVWSSNWIGLKLGLARADPIVFNNHRLAAAVVTLFVVLLLQRRRLLPQSWVAVIVTGFFQTTMNMGSTTMALVEGGVGRTSVLVFTMPFWTMLLAWPVLGERVRGLQWIAIAFALIGLTFVVEPWNWHGQLKPKLWAVQSGFGWAAGTVALKYFQRERRFDMLNFTVWQMLVGLLPLCLIPLAVTLPETQWSFEYFLLLLWTGTLSTAAGFVLWFGVLRFLPAGTASLNMLAIPVIALLLSMLIFGERLAASEWIGIGCIGAGLALISLRAWWGSRRGEAPPLPPLPLEGG
jgi:drug/metabolite transporter (DMT)-like permease